MPRQCSPPPLHTKTPPMAACTVNAPTPPHQRAAHRCPAPAHHQPLRADCARAHTSAPIRCPSLPRQCRPPPLHAKTPPMAAPTVNAPTLPHQDAAHRCPASKRPHPSTPTRRPSLPRHCTPLTSCTPSPVALPSRERESEDSKTEKEHVKAARQRTSMLRQQDRKRAREDSKTENEHVKAARQRTSMLRKQDRK